ncbi:unnamed protein product [Wickerhamomyces anomalus]
MSNTEASIIDDVINDSRQDFEDSGIDEATLQDLRTTRVANFSWAPDAIVNNGLSTDPQNITEASSITSDVKKENSAVPIPQESTTGNFELELQGSNGDIAKSLQKQKENIEKKERTLASLDSDDINSDLDDSDEEDLGSDEDGDDAEGMIILCLYEKVLRVKNKWKCNLKDGVANINGKDYAFAKGTGESEW